MNLNNLYNQNSPGDCETRVEVGDSIIELEAGTGVVVCNDSAGVLDIRLSRSRLLLFKETDEVEILELTEDGAILSFNEAAKINKVLRIKHGLTYLLVPARVVTRVFD